jgi:hypothetical protein
MATRFKVFAVVVALAAGTSSAAMAQYAAPAPGYPSNPVSGAAAGEMAGTRTVPPKTVPSARSLVGQLALLPAPWPAPPMRSRAPHGPAPRDIRTITASATRPASLQRAGGAECGAKALEESARARRPQGSIGETDMHRAQQHAPLMEIVVP